MKRLKAIVIAVLAALLSLSLFGCASASSDYPPAESATYTISPENINSNLTEFVENNTDRTRFTNAEKEAAEFLRQKLASYGYGGELVRDFTAKDGSLELASQNVVAVYEPAGLSQDHKNIIIGANYDNTFATPYQNSAQIGTKSTGALSNGTGVAAILSIAEYLMNNKPALEFSVTMAFFGASAVNSVGASKFYESMTAEEYDSTVLMVEMQRLGVDYVYSFSDARKTKREAFFDDVASKSGLPIRKATQKSPAILNVTALSGVPYFQWAMYGNGAVFFNHNIPTLNLVGANWETMALNDRESATNGNIENTQNDTLENLLNLYPDYATKVAAAATLVVNAVSSDDFIATMEYDKNNFPNTDVLNKNWIWELIVIAIAVLVAAGVMLVNNHLHKKYPVAAPPQPKTMKMAVFGMDYEDKDGADIFVDIKPNNPDDEIFPGIANNDPQVTPIAPVDALNEIFGFDTTGKKNDENDKDSDKKNDEKGEGNDKPDEKGKDNDNDQDKR